MCRASYFRQHRRDRGGGCFTCNLPIGLSQLFVGHIVFGDTIGAVGLEEI